MDEGPREGEAVRIDAHQHFWRYTAAEYGWIDGAMAPLRRDYVPADLRHEMARAGFDACVAVQARQTLDETRSVVDEDDGVGAGPVCAVELDPPYVTVSTGRFALLMSVGV